MWPVDAYPNGIVTYVHILRSELLNQGHRVSVFAGKVRAGDRDPGIHEILPTLTYRALRKLRGLAGDDSFNVRHWGKAIAAVVNAVHRADPIDVLEMEESFGWCGEVQELTRIPFVVRLHGPEFLTRTSASAQADFASDRVAMEGKALQAMPAITSPSRCTLTDTLSQFALHPRISKVIPNPIIVDANVEPWHLDKCDRKTILFVGQFSKVKGGDMALMAFRKLLDAEPALKLIFVGVDNGIASAGGPTVFFEEFRNSLFTAAQRANVVYLGQRSRVEIVGLRRQAMVTIVVSRWENQPNTALEAMILGCPVVAFDVGGVSEIVENEVTGLLAQSEDIDDLCRKISRLLDDPVGARQMGEAARRHVSERHAVQKLAKETVNVYRDVISMANARR